MPRRLLALALVLAFAAPAVAQTDFVPDEPYWLGPGSTVGILFDTVNLEIQVDADGDGLLEPTEPTYPAPTALLQTVGFAQLRLSPSREHVILSGTAVNGPCSGQNSFYVYRLPPNAGDPLELAGPPICVDTSVAFVGFYDPIASDEQDVFFVVETQDISLRQQIWFKRLFDGTTAPGTFPLDASIGQITFAPTGVAAFVQFDVDGLDNLDSYQMFGLCTDNLGSFVGVSQGSVTDVSGGGVATARQLTATTAEVIRASDSQQIAQYTLDDCSGPLPDTGACCLPDGSCSPGTTQAGCEGAGGTWQGANTDCVGLNCPPPPTVEWVLAASGPASVTAPTTFSYTIDYDNVGTLDAQGATLFATVPAFSTFEGASNGGSYDPFSRRITWSLGTVAGGGGGQVSFSVSVACGVTSVRFDTYSVQSSTPVTFQVGSGIVFTNVSVGGGGPLTVSSSSVSDTGNPPGDGDTVTHTVSMVETDGVDRRNVRFQFNTGSVWDYDQAVSEGGGSITTNGNFLSWVGDVGANSTVDVVFRTRVPDCRQGFQTQDSLNSGFDIRVFSECSASLGTAPVDTVVLAPVPVSGSLTFSGDIGPVANGGFGGGSALVRLGGTIEALATVNNVGVDAQDSVTMSFAIPAELVPVGNPPFVGTPPAGATWDAVTSTATWSGALLPGQSTSFRLALTYPSNGPCASILSNLVGYGNCPQSSSVSTRLYAIGAVNPNPHVLSVTPFNGLFSFTPGVDAEQQDFLCIFNEILVGVTAGLNDEVWVAGTPTFRMNPVTLDLEFISAPWAVDLGMFAPRDIGVDPNSGLVAFAGNRQEFQPLSYARVGVWDRTTGQTTILLDDPDPPVHREARSVDFLPDGRVVTATNAGIVILDPSQPAAAPVIWTDPSAPGVIAGSVAVRPDGLIAASDFNFSSGASKSIRLYDPDTGVMAPFVNDLLDIYPGGVIPYGIDVSDAGDTWLATGIVSQITGDPTPGASITVLGGLGPKEDVAWVAGATSTGVDDEIVDRALPRRLALHAPVPNPFNPRTEISFDLPRDETIRVELYDARGRQVRTLVEGRREAGTHRFTWDGTDDQGRGVSSGVYYVRLLTPTAKQVRKAVLVR